MESTHSGHEADHFPVLPHPIQGALQICDRMAKLEVHLPGAVTRGAAGQPFEHGKPATADVLGVRARRLNHQVSEVSILFYERRHQFVIQAESIVANEHLTVAERTSSNANG